MNINNFSCFNKINISSEQGPYSHLWQIAENFLFLGGQSVKVVQVDAKKLSVEAQPREARSWLSTLVKVALYCTVLLPAIALCVRYSYRRHYTFSLVLSPLVKEIIHNPSKALKNNEFKTQCSNLGYCDCIKMVTRLSLVQTSIQRLKEVHPDLHAPLTIVSVGSGQCFQELLFLCQLKEAGYINIRLQLIENAPNDLSHQKYAQQVSNAMEELKNFVHTQMPDLKFQMTHVSTLEDYHQKNLAKPDLLMLIDLQGDQVQVEEKLIDFNEYAFSFLNNHHHLSSEKTVIARTDRARDGQGGKTAHVTVHKSA